MWSSLANLCSNGRLVWGDPQRSNGILSQYRNARRRVLTGCGAAERPRGCIPRYTIRGQAERGRRGLAADFKPAGMRSVGAGGRVHRHREGPS